MLNPEIACTADKHSLTIEFQKFYSSCMGIKRLASTVRVTVPVSNQSSVVIFRDEK